MAATFEGVQCWYDERISQVINKEAVSVEVADFLATHTPINRVRFGTFDETNHRIRQSESSLRERELLQDLWRYASEDRHTFAVVQGIPGTGKSHLIRWLKEHYELQNRQNGERDIVVLIERAQCNLRDTLRQIIKLPIFAETELREQQERLKTASNELSNAALADNILDQLRVAATEVILEDRERPKAFIRRRIEKFLLDSDIRDELKKPGGPVDRLIRFLSASSKSQVSRDKLPEFLPEDFEFNQDLLWKLREEGKREAVELLEKLVGGDGVEEAEETRRDLARFLSHNKLLNYSVGRIAAISADDLKQLFYDLRRYLQRKGRNLALFIEDIAAFTGVDIGLIDVLVTQHTGESNREFCRMLSVVGITEDYYNDRLPDNIKTRATHTLSLEVTRNSRDGRDASSLLNTPEAVSMMAARYLNALRLKQTDLEKWHRERHANPADLPNACSSCVHRPVCHKAFGKINISAAGDDSQEVGLYPFNQQALWTMYERSTTIARTPRTLLGSVISHVLDKHGDKIRVGQFPPEENLGSEFEAPTLSQLLAQSIRSQAGVTAGRAETLIRFWAATDEQNRRLPGSLAPEVFKAFALPPLQFENSLSEVEVILPKAGSAPAPSVTTSSGPDYKADIDKWARDPNYRLQNYERLTELLLSIIRNYIDWEAHGISSVQLNERFQVRGRLYIENQAAKPTLKEYITLRRDPELATVLEAVIEVGGGEYGQWSQPSLGGHMLNLGRWLRKIEPQIVAFVRQPVQGVPEPKPLVEISLLNCIVTDILLGQLGLEHSGGPALLRGLFKSWGKLDEAAGQAKKQLEQARQSQGRSSLWHDLLKGLDPEKLKEVRRTCLLLLNRAQGESLDIRFIDAALALDLLAAFELRQWQLELLNITFESNVPAWRENVGLYANLETHFSVVLDEEFNQARQRLAQLQNFVGDNKPEEVFATIEELLAALKKHRRPHNPVAEAELNSGDLKTIIAGLTQLMFHINPKEQALALSGSTGLFKETLRYLNYLQKVCELAEKQKQLLTSEIAQAQGKSAGNLEQVIERLYVEVESRLINLPHVLQEVEA